MSGIFQIFVFICIVIASIYTLQTGFEYMKNILTPKVTKNMYKSQIEKYREILEEMQESYIQDNATEISESILEPSEDPEKIEMVQELTDFIEHSIKEYK
jgi:hypothetical protein